MGAEKAALDTPLKMAVGQRRKNLA